MHGSVVDVEFQDRILPIYTVLRTGRSREVIIEILAQLDAHRVRGIALTPTEGLVTQIPIDVEKERESGRMQQLYLLHNRSVSGSVYENTRRRLLPFDARWRRDLKKTEWPSRMVPEVLGGGESTLAALVREYLFVSIYRTCAESLAAENACRLAAMQRAEKNINGMLEDLGHSFDQLRQAEIDEELFDVVSGYEALVANGSSTRQTINKRN